MSDNPPSIYAHIALDGRLLEARTEPPVSSVTMGGKVYEYEVKHTLKCSNCGSSLTSTPTDEGTVLEVNPCSCEGRCLLCGGSGVDFDARGHSRPCPCKTERKEA